MNLSHAKKKLITIVVPAYNESENIPALNIRLSAVVSQLTDYDFEIILIDNSSKDNSYEIACKIAEADPRWRCYRFSRNFGAEASLAAGLELAKGDAVIILFSDLQEPPEKIPEMIALWEEGNDVVYGLLSKREGRSMLVDMMSKIAYKIIYNLSDIKIPQNATDFRLLSRRCVDSLNLCKERNRYLRGLVHWVGYKQTGFTYDRSQRTKGKSSTNMSFLIWYAFNAIVSFSSKPLQLASIFGMLVTALSFVLFFVYLGLHIISGLGILNLNPPPVGWTTQFLMMLFFFGMQFTFIGIIGKYISQTYEESKNRPSWLIQDHFSKDKP